MRWLLLLSWLASSATATVAITEAEYEGAAHFVIRTRTATYWYDKAGGGFSRLIDGDGKDWISFKREPWGVTPASAASSYRGIPNFVFGSEDAGAGHPGFTKCESRKVSGREITTTSKSGKWRWTWTFADDHARVTIEKAGLEGYWFLYEGTPGGRYAPRSYYWGNDSAGPRRELPDHLKGDRRIESMRWAYFGSDASPRVLFLVQRQRDGVPDVFAVMGNSKAGLDSSDGMTVFGFGRAKEARGLLRDAPQSFAIGFYESRITTAREHDGLARYLGELLAWKPLQ